MPENCTAQIIAKREIIPGTFLMTFQAPGIARQAKPGQFVMAQAQEGTDPLLRRPISLCGAADDCIELLFQVRGRGTSLMAAWEPGYRAKFLGPLGNGFMIPPDIKAAVLVAGGIGAAPLLFLARKLLGYSGIKREFYFGTKTGTELPIVEDVLKKSGFDFFFASESGFPNTFQGFITGIFARNLQLKKISIADAHIYSCGPEPMLKKVSDLALQYSMPCQVSLEARMACGVGACLGCVVQTYDGYKRVCADGPVFESKEISWSHD